MNTQTVTLDVTKRRQVMPEIRIGQGDKDGTTLVANIYDNGEPFTLTSYSVRFAMRLPFDMAYYSVVGTVSGNTATFQIDESYAASVAGVTEVAYVEVLSGTTIICSTNRIRVVCLESAYENVDPAHLWDNGLDEAIARANAAAEAAEGVVMGDVPTMSTNIKGGAKLGAGLEVDGNERLKVADELLNGTVRSFDTVADMQAATDLKAGVTCHTNGFYASGDGGAAFYKITATGTANGMDVLACGDVFANLVIDEYMSPVAFGANHTTNSSSIIQRMLNVGVGIDGQNKTYIVETTITPVASMQIKNCVFDFNEVGNGFFTRSTHSSYNAPTSVFSQYLYVENCEFKNAVDYGIASSRTTSYDAALPVYAKVAVIKDTSFHDNKCHGLILYADLSNSDAFKNVRIENCKAFNNGIYDTTNRTTIKTGIGIGAYLDANDINSNIVINGCEAYLNANSGIAPHGIKNVVITNCFSHDNHEHGFVFQTNKSGTISNCIANSNSSRGIRIQGDFTESSYCKNITVTNCVVNDSRAFNIGGGVENVIIQNNVFNTNTASAFCVNFDPHGYPDNNILVTNNMFNIRSSDGTYPVRLLEAPCSDDSNIRFVDNVINGNLEKINGYVIGSSANVDTKIVNFKPQLGYASYTNWVNSLVASNGTLTDGVFTSNSSSGAVRKDVTISSTDKMFALYVNATPLAFGSDDSGGSGYLRFNIRGSSGYIADLGLASAVQFATILNNASTWCALLDLNQLREAYPSATIIRCFFYITHAGDQMQINEFSTCTV